mgnify:CR=1 FL=1|tara:strand:+ start:845 stop:1513 length:669 start_codon:yes stop_codon:yes gene_type:complete
MDLQKIIIGTPRSGTSFVTKWYVNENPKHIALDEQRLYEHFEPDYPDWPDNNNFKAIDEETKKRIEKLPRNCIFKMHTGPEMSEYAWKFVYEKPVILVKREDVLGQFISYGIGWTTFKWYILKDWKQESLSGLKEGEQFIYKKEWFDNLAWRIRDLFYREPHFKHIESTVWFEDLPEFPNNGNLLVRQNPKSNEEKLKLIKNVDQFKNWFKEFEKEKERWKR